MTKAQGHVYIAGAGPGDPKLVTVATIEALSRADVVLYDALSSPTLLRYAPSSAELIYVGKRAKQHAFNQEDIQATLVEHGSAGKQVVRLKGGDPFVYGRGGEEAMACRAAGIPYTVIPGISSAMAAPAYAGIPVTHREIAESFLMMTASTANGREPDWSAAAAADTITVLMGRQRLGDVCKALVDAGKPAETPAACIQWGTRQDQVVVRGTLNTLPELADEAGLRPPVVTIVGPTVELADRIGWFQRGPLGGKRIVVTRARSQASELAERLSALGAMVIEAPVIQATLRSDDAAFRAAVDESWDWIVFTSANGVQAYLAALRGSGRDMRALGSTKLAAIGDATAEELRNAWVEPDFIPSKATSERLAAEAPFAGGERVLYPASSLSETIFADAMRDRGVVVEQVVAYDNRVEPLDAQQVREVLEADVVTFTSASTARNLRGALGGDVAVGAKLVSIGAKTSEAVQQEFGRVDREAEEPSLDALVEAVLEVLA